MGLEGVSFEIGAWSLAEADAPALALATSSAFFIALNRIS